MHKRLLVVIIAVVTAFLFSACTDNAQVMDNFRHMVARTIQGEIEAEIGNTYTTQWFDFTVEHIKRIDGYANQVPQNGYMLINVLITKRGTFYDTSPVPVGIFDFYMNSSAFEERIYPINPLSDYMMPREFNLFYNETVTFHMIYEVPKDVPDLTLVHTEWDETDRKGASFSISINLNEL